MINHRESWAVEQRSPTRAAFLAGDEGTPKKVERDEKEDPRKDWPTGQAAFSSKPSTVVIRRRSGGGSSEGSGS